MLNSLPVSRLTSMGESEHSSSIAPARTGRLNSRLPGEKSRLWRFSSRFPILIRGANQAGYAFFSESDPLIAWNRNQDSGGRY